MGYWDSSVGRALWDTGIAQWVEHYEITGHPVPQALWSHAAPPSVPRAPRASRYHEPSGATPLVPPPPGAMLHMHLRFAGSHTGLQSQVMVYTHFAGQHTSLRSQIMVYMRFAGPHAGLRSQVMVYTRFAGPHTGLRSQVMVYMRFAGPHTGLRSQVMVYYHTSSLQGICSKSSYTHL